MAADAHHRQRARVVVRLAGAAAQRLRFMLDFGYATGLRISELADATLRSIEVDAAGDHWLHVVGKGGKPARLP
jgi:site-specific recombinase XerD